MDTNNGVKPVIRYSEAFKIEVVRALESGSSSIMGTQRKYGIKGGNTVRRWVHRYGNGTVGRIIRVEKPQEIDERKQLKKRIRDLERLLADANINLALEQAFTELACERAGVDVEEFKKKAAGQLRTRR